MEIKDCIIIQIIIVGFGLLVFSLCGLSEETYPKEVSEFTKIITERTLTNDAVPYEISCEWHLNDNSDEIQQLKINSIVGNTIQITFQKYSHEDILNNVDEIIIDLRKRIVDCVFPLQPYGFSLGNISIKKTYYKQYYKQVEIPRLLESKIALVRITLMWLECFKTNNSHSQLFFFCNFVIL